MCSGRQSTLGIMVNHKSPLCAIWPEIYPLFLLFSGHCKTIRMVQHDRGQAKFTLGQITLTRKHGTPGSQGSAPNIRRQSLWSCHRTFIPPFNIITLVTNLYRFCGNSSCFTWVLATVIMLLHRLHKDETIPLYAKYRK